MRTSDAQRLAETMTSYCQTLNLLDYTDERIAQIRENAMNVLVKEIISDWLIVHPLPSYGISNRTPLFYSVGLNEDGTWDAPDSPYGAKGGLIAFADGDVVSVRNAKSVLISPETGQPTENIAETFPKGAVPVRYFQLGK